MRWDGAVAVVTGGSRGIGREVAKQAAQKGARVGLIARSGRDLEAVLKEIGGRGAVATADVTDQQATEQALAHLASEVLEGGTDASDIDREVTWRGRRRDHSLRGHITRIWGGHCARRGP